MFKKTHKPGNKYAAPFLKFHRKPGFNPVKSDRITFNDVVNALEKHLYLEETSGIVFKTMLSELDENPALFADVVHDLGIPIQRFYTYAGQRFTNKGKEALTDVIKYKLSKGNQKGAIHYARIKYAKNADTILDRICVGDLVELANLYKDFQTK